MTAGLREPQELGIRARGLDPGSLSASWWPWASWFTSGGGRKGGMAVGSAGTWLPGGTARALKGGREAVLGTTRALQPGLRSPAGLSPPPLPPHACDP